MNHGIISLRHMHTLNAAVFRLLRNACPSHHGGHQVSPTATTQTTTTTPAYRALKLAGKWVLKHVIDQLAALMQAGFDAMPHTTDTTPAYRALKLAGKSALKHVNSQLATRTQLSLVVTATSTMLRTPLLTVH
jgi:hypothetical protein